MKKDKMEAFSEPLKRLTTKELDMLLQAELQQEHVDELNVRMILHVLKEREWDYPVEMTPEVERAWKKYRRDIARLEQKPSAFRGTRSWILRVAPVAAVLALVLIAVPQRAAAESIWEKLARWTDSVFAFFSPEEDFSMDEYVFQTDNPGLQQVYEAVVELGVTDPVVPMWLPEGYELEEVVSVANPIESNVHARFINGDDEMVYNLVVLSEDKMSYFMKDDTPVETIERFGTTYNVFRNNDLWTIAWKNKNVEVAIFIDCQEDSLKQLIYSIYKRGNESEEIS